ncbi:MAG: DMT family transporter [Planctomycetota bacterium]|jgi:drug/metabolite transporter (DMT)-like permease
MTGAAESLAAGAAGERAGVSREQLRGMLAILAAWLLWSMDPVIVCGIGDKVPRLPLAGLGALFGGLVFFRPLAGLLRGWRRLPAGCRALLVVQAVCFTAVTELCYVAALRHLSAGVVGGVLRTQVAFAVLFAMIFLGERMSRLSAAGILVILAANGGLLVAVLLAPGEKSSALGWVLAFVASLLWSAGTVTTKRILKVLRPGEVAGFRMTAGGALLLAGSVFSDGPGALTQFDVRTWLLLLVKGVLTFGLAFAFYYYGLKRLRVYVASAFEPLAPLFTLAGAYLLLGQQPRAGEMLGVAALLVGALVVILGLRRNDSPGRHEERSEAHSPAVAERGVQASLGDQRRSSATRDLRVRNKGGLLRVGLRARWGSEL